MEQKMYRVAGVLLHVFIMYTAVHGQICRNVQKSDVAVTKTAPASDTIEVTDLNKMQDSATLSCTWTAAYTGDICNNFLLMQFTPVGKDKRENICGAEGPSGRHGNADTYDGKDRLSCTFNYGTDNKDGDMSMTLTGLTEVDLGQYFCTYTISGTNVDANLTITYTKPSTISCYECVGSSSGLAKYTVEECDGLSDLSKADREKYLVACPGEATRCKKTFQEIGKARRSTYQCAVHGPSDQQQCVRRAGTGGDPIVHYCHCTTDRCNHGYALTPLSLTITLITLGMCALLG